MPNKGLVIFFTGLSGSGKTTIAEALREKIMKDLRLPVTMLDGDVVRTFLSSELGFSKEHRDLNIRRIGFVAAEVAKHSGIAICCPIAPYDNIRKEVRKMVTDSDGRFLLVYVATSLAECERRDVKGLYAKARAGLIKQFTGISDPYEVPTDAEIVVDTTGKSISSCTNQVFSKIA